jgi:hypothetical protein
MRRVLFSFGLGREGWGGAGGQRAVVLSGLGCLTSALNGTVEQEAVMQRQLYELDLVRDIISVYWVAVGADP